MKHRRKRNKTGYRVKRLVRVGLISRMLSVAAKGRETQTDLNRTERISMDSCNLKGQCRSVVCNLFHPFSIFFCFSGRFLPSGSSANCLCPHWSFSTSHTMPVVRCHFPKSHSKSSLETALTQSAVILGASRCGQVEVVL